MVVVVVVVVAVDVLAVVVVRVVVVGIVVVVVGVGTGVCVEAAWHVCCMNSASMALRSLKSATVKTVVCCPVGGGDAIPRSSSSLMSCPMPMAAHKQTRLRYYDNAKWYKWCNKHCLV